MVNQVLTIGPGLRRVQNLIKNIPKNIQKEVLINGAREIALSGQRRIISRYKIAGYSGSMHGIQMLGKKMKLIKKGNSSIYTIEIPGYLGMIEEGVSSHWVSIETIKQHLASPGSTTGKRQPKGTVFSGPPVYWHYKGPFIKPGLKAMEQDIPRIIERVVAKAIKRTGGGTWNLI